MGPLISTIRCARKSVSSILLLVAAFTLSTNRGFASNQNVETIQATYAQASNLIVITLSIRSYSTLSDLQILSLAFEEGQDRGLATALSKTEAVGQCSITGALSYNVAFIQMILTPTGRKITFITSRPHLSDDADPPDLPESFDLAVGEFDLNDADPAKSTGFLFPASKLVINKQGEYHYDLDGMPWGLVNVLDSPGTPA